MAKTPHLRTWLPYNRGAKHSYRRGERCVVVPAFSEARYEMPQKSPPVTIGRRCLASSLASICSHGRGGKERKGRRVPRSCWPRVQYGSTTDSSAHATVVPYERKEKYRGRTKFGRARRAEDELAQDGGDDGGGCGTSDAGGTRLGRPLCGGGLPPSHHEDPQ